MQASTALNGSGRPSGLPTTLVAVWEQALQLPVRVSPWVTLFSHLSRPTCSG